MAKATNPRPRQYQRTGQTFMVPGGGARRRGQGGLAGSFQDAQDSANAANEARYAQMLQGYDDLQGRAMGRVDNLGDQSRKDIDRQYRQSGARNYQQLVNRGFANSSQLAMLGQSNERERQSSQNRLSDQIAQQQNGLDIGITQGKLGAIERRNDVGPDPNMLANLSQGLGAGGYGQRPLMPGGQGFGSYGGGGYGEMLQNAWSRGMQNQLQNMGGGSRRTYSRKQRGNRSDRLARNQAQAAQQQAIKQSQQNAYTYSGSERGAVSQGPFSYTGQGRSDSMGPFSYSGQQNSASSDPFAGFYSRNMTGYKRRR